MKRYAVNSAVKLAFVNINTTWSTKYFCLEKLETIQNRGLCTVCGSLYYLRHKYTPICKKITGQCLTGPRFLRSSSHRQPVFEKVEGKVQSNETEHVIRQESPKNAPISSTRNNYFTDSNIATSLEHSQETDLQQIRKEPLISGRDALSPATEEDVEHISRALKPTFNIAAYVNESETLQQLVKLGVDLSKIESKRDNARYLLTLDFEKDVKPYIRFLHDRGVEADSLGHILTKNIRLCQESLEDLEIRINYLESKKFKSDEIAIIITRNPFWLSTPVSVIDSRLGWLQTAFKLTGDDVRSVVNALPQLITYNVNSIKLNMFVLEEEMGMSKGMMKRLLMTRPRIYIKNQNKLLKSFEYVHNTMKVPADIICAQPDILMDRQHKIRERHLFLTSLGRAQYNARLPGYVSLDVLVKTDDVQFCEEIAKSSVQSYNLFLKTL